VAVVADLDDDDRLRALEQGEVDLVTDLPGQRVPALKRLPGLQVQTDVSQRTLLIGMDQFSDSLRYGHTGMGNPFRDQRVRHAMALAINERGSRGVMARDIIDMIGLAEDALEDDIAFPEGEPEE